MIVFACPKCHDELEVKDSRAGQRTVCPNCDRGIRVPTLEEEDELDRPPPTKKKRRRKKSSWNLPALPSARNFIFGVLFCLLGSIMACGGLTSGEAPAMMAGGFI